LGGLLVSDEVVDLFLPVRFYWVRRRQWLKEHGLTEEDVKSMVGNDLRAEQRKDRGPIPAPTACPAEPSPLKV
jgi:hypothetical protein